MQPRYGEVSSMDIWQAEQHQHQELRGWRICRPWYQCQQTLENPETQQRDMTQEPLGDCETWLCETRLRAFSSNH